MLENQGKIREFDSGNPVGTVMLISVTVKPLLVYSMGIESSDEMKLSPTRKKLTFEFYFIFSSDMLSRQ